MENAYAIQDAPEHNNDPETPSIPELIQAIDHLKSQLAELSRQEKEIKAQKDALEFKLIQSIEGLGEGMDMVRAGRRKALISTQQLPQVKDWDAFAECVYRNNALHLMQRRVSSKAVEEWTEANGPINGIEFYERKTVTISNA